MAEKMTQMTFLTKQIVDLIAQDAALSSRLTNIEKEGGLIAVAKSEAIAVAEAKDTALHTIVTGEIATAKSEAISTATDALADAIEQEVLDRNSAIATAKSEAIADAASKDAALYETVTSDIATAKAAAEEVAAADATAKANAAQAAAEANATAANALTEAKLSAEGEVAFTAESTVRGALDAVNAVLPYKADLVDGKVPANQLPSYVDDVKEVYIDGNVAYSDAEKTTVVTLETDKIYVDLVSNKTYRFSGTVLVEISQSLAIGETAETAFAGNRGKQAEEDIDALEGRMSTAEGEIDVLQAATTGYDANNTVAGAIATAKSEAQAAAEATAASALAAKAAELVEAIEDAQAAAEATAAADATSKADAAQNAAISASTAALANEVTERNAAIATAKAEAIAAAEGTAAGALNDEINARGAADQALQNQLYSEGEEAAFTAENTVRAAITAVDNKADTNAGNITAITNRVSALEQANVAEEADIDALEGRMDTAEADIDAIQAAIGDGTGAGSLSARMAAAEGDIDVLQAIHARGVKVVSEDPAGTAVTFNYTTEAALHVTAEISSLTNIVPANFGIGCSGYILVDASSEMYTINGKAVPNPLKELVSEFTHGVFRVTCVNTDDYVIELVRFVPVEETVNA